MLKSVIRVFKEINRHWVGDGFYVYGLLRPDNELNKVISPFILLDYAAPMHFEPSQIPKGVGRHPHRGFETVTIVEKGIIDHSDSLGFSARYGDGDVQWLTAGDGIQHSEMFPLFNKGDNNPIDFFQIWINLEAKKKRVKPNFSMFWKNEIPKIITIDKNNIETEILLIAGEYSSKQAPKSPPDSWASNIENNVNIWKIKMNGKAQWELPKVNKQIIRTLYIYHGSGVIINGQTI